MVANRVGLCRNVVRIVVKVVIEKSGVEGRVVGNHSLGLGDRKKEVRGTQDNLEDLSWEC